MKKINLVCRFSEKLLDGSNDYSFLNPASIRISLKVKGSEKIKYFIDGGLLVKVLNKYILKKNLVNRVSFDNTSIAKEVFSLCEIRKIKIFFVGAKHDEIKKFVEKIRSSYSDLEIVGYNSGYYLAGEEYEIFKKINDGRAGLVVIGLGAGKQEEFMLSLRNSGYKGVAFSCGGFIRQECATTKDYYPYLINKFSLRWLFRMIKEPHTIRRYLFDYPKNLIWLLCEIKNSRLSFLVVDNEG